MKKGCLWAVGVLVVVMVIGMFGIRDAVKNSTTSTEAPAVVATAPVDTVAIAQARRDLAALSSEFDAVAGDTTYRDPRAAKFVNSRKAISVYLVTAGAKLRARMAITYVADDWLFVRSFSVRTDSGSYELEPEPYGPTAVERDNGDGKIWEWWDVNADPHRAMLADIARSKKVIVRFNGKQYHKDWTVPEGDKRAIARMLSASLSR